MVLKAKKEQIRTLQDVLITVVAVVENDRDIVKKVITEISEELSKRYRYYEILVIDNGSLDGSDIEVKHLLETIPNIRLLVLSRTYHLEVAYAAALDNSIGDYVVLMDINFDPPKLISALVTKAIEGYDLVVAERKNRSDNTFFERLSARFFYSITGRILGFRFSSNASYFRVLSRKVVNSVVKIKSKHRYLKYFSALVGFKQTVVVYSRVPRRKFDRHKRSFIGSTIFALDVLFSNSSFPLRFATFLGAVASFINLLFLGYVFIVAIIKQRIAEGWITTSVMNATMFFLLFVILTIMSEYIARILWEAKDQPLYFVAEEVDSKEVFSSKKRINVV